MIEYETERLLAGYLQSLAAGGGSTGLEGYAIRPWHDGETRGSRPMELTVSCAPGNPGGMDIPTTLFLRTSAYDGERTLVETHYAAAHYLRGVFGRENVNSLKGLSYDFAEAEGFAARINGLQIVGEGSDGSGTGDEGKNWATDIAMLVDAYVV